MLLKDTPLAQQLAEGGVPKHLTIILGVLLLISLGWWVGSFRKGSTDERMSAIIIKPYQHEALIQFPEATLLPDESKVKPFLLQISNIGEVDVTKVRIEFEIFGLDLKSLVETSHIFKLGAPLKGNSAFLLTRYNGQKSGTEVQLSVTGQRIVNIIPGGGEKVIEIDMPSNIKAALSLFMISEAERKDRLLSGQRRNIAMEMTEDLAKNHARLSASFYEGIIEMPPIKMQVTWLRAGKGETKESFVLNSVYMPLGGVHWVRTDKEAKESYYLMGGMGTLSYQNLNEPESGFYNQWKRRKENIGAQQMLKP